jgi:hypothetical protein
MNKAAAKERSDCVESPEGFINAHPDEIRANREKEQTE